MKYIEIIYLAEWDMPDDFFYMNDDEMIDYLSKWDYGTESEHTLYDELPIDKNHLQYKRDDYFLVYSTSYGYAALYRQITE